jgi:hypothetical protein
MWSHSKMIIAASNTKILQITQVSRENREENDRVHMVGYYIASAAAKTNATNHMLRSEKNKLKNTCSMIYFIQCSKSFNYYIFL